MQDCVGLDCYFIPAFYFSAEERDTGIARSLLTQGCRGPRHSTWRVVLIASIVRPLDGPLADSHSTMRSWKIFIGHGDLFEILSMFGLQHRRVSTCTLGQDGSDLQRNPILTAPVMSIPVSGSKLSVDEALRQKTDVISSSSQKIGGWCMVNDTSRASFPRAPALEMFKSRFDCQPEEEEGL